MNYLVIHWLDTAPQAHCHLTVWNEHGAISWQQQHVVLAQLRHSLAANASINKHTHITVLIPGEWVSISNVKLPKRLPKKNLAQLIGYALEDELLDDPSHLHFVIATPGKSTAKGKPKGEDPERAVAMVSKAKLASLQQHLRAHEIEAAIALPEYFALQAPSVRTTNTTTTSGDDSSSKQAASATEQHTWYASLEGERAILRTDMLQGYAIASARLPWFCQQLIQRDLEHPDGAITDRRSFSLQLYSRDTELPWEWPPELAAQLSLQAHTQCTAEQCLSFTAIQNPVINLFSHEFRSKSKQKLRAGKNTTGAANTQRLWRRCLYLLIIFILLAFISNGVRYWVLAKQNQIFLQQAITQAEGYAPRSMRSEISNTTSLTPLKNKLGQLLSQLQKFSRHNDILRQLNQIDDFFAKYKNTQVINTNYTAPKWNVTLNVDKLDTLNRMTVALSHQGWQVNQTISPQSASDIQAKISTLDPTLQSQALSILKNQGDSTSDQSTQTGPYNPTHKKGLIAVLTLQKK